MGIKRDGFIFYRSWHEAIISLPAEVRAEVLTGIIEYALNGELTNTMGKIANAIFVLVKPQIDANNQRFVNGQKGADFGNLGGNPNFKKGQANPYYERSNDDISYIKDNRDNPKDNPKITPKEKEKDKEQEKEKEQEKDSVKGKTGTMPPNPPKRVSFCAKDVLKPDDVGFDLLQRWLKYRCDIKKPYKCLESVRQFWKQLEIYSDDKLKTAEEIVNQSIANQWTGIFPLKSEGKK
jgi:hypothetical protein